MCCQTPTLERERLFLTCCVMMSVTHTQNIHCIWSESEQQENNRDEQTRTRSVGHRFLWHTPTLVSSWFHDSFMRRPYRQALHLPRQLCDTWNSFQSEKKKQNSLHSSIVEGSEPQRWRHQVQRNHHLPVLFERLLKPLNQTDGLVLQRVQLGGVRRVPPALLKRWRGRRLRLLFCSAGGRRHQPASTWRRRRRGEAAAAAAENRHWRLVDGGAEQSVRHCQATQRAAGEEVLHHRHLLLLDLSCCCCYFQTRSDKNNSDQRTVSLHFCQKQHFFLKIRNTFCHEEPN